MFRKVCILIVAACLTLAPVYGAGDLLGLMGAGGKIPAAGAAAPSFTLAGTFTSSSSGATITTTMNVGTAAASRIIVIGAASQNSPPLTTATVNGVNCTLDVSITETGIFSCAGASFGSGTQTIAVTWTGSGFDARGIAVWIVSNAASSTVVHTGSNTINPSTISVTNGDLMFSANHATGGTAPTYSSSTVAPNDTGVIFASVSGYADWKITSTNASFSVTPQVTSSLINYAVATYH